MREQRKRRFPWDDLLLLSALAACGVGLYQLHPAAAWCGAGLAGLATWFLCFVRRRRR